MLSEIETILFLLAQFLSVTSNPANPVRGLIQSPSLSYRLIRFLMAEIVVYPPPPSLDISLITARYCLLFISIPAALSLSFVSLLLIGIPDIC